MSWVNLDDVYVNKSGDSIAGNLSVGGALTINDAKGGGGTYNVANEITTLQDSVYQDTGRVFLYSDQKWGSVSYRAKGGVCTLTVNSVGGITAGGSWTVPKAMPSKFLPDESAYAALCHRQTDHQSQVWVPGKKYENSDLVIYSALDTTNVSTRISGIVSWVY